MIKNKKILVFGSNGFIGSNFCQKISPKNIIHKVSFKNKNLKNINLGNYYFSDIYSLIKKNNFDYILNFHAHTDIDYANTYPKYDFFHNCSITHSIIEALIKNKSKSFFLNFGTVTQIGFTNIKNRINYNFKGKPLNIFDLHKQYNEDYISINKKLFNLKATTLRLSNVFGIGITASKNRGVINKIIDKATLEKKITLFGNGNNIRDFIYIDDVISGIIIALKKFDKLNKDYYFLTSGKGKSLKQFAKIINSQLRNIYGYNAIIKFQKWPNSSTILDKRSFIGNPSSFEKATGWKPRFSLKNAIKHYINNKKEFY